ncbi:hypothetical protein VTN77DRAFT_8416 [Rasamsonia byssochlamydoides]|uniref:uncharacterized protein n=1 Tax=Rasamsonia byssochlamydoides TaxID=89139 RepID=UPI003741F22F
MSWLFGSSKTSTTTAPSPADNAQQQTSSQSSSGSKPKPCCVCKEEKSARDDCMLFSKSSDPEQDCRPLIEQYRNCMAGYGFKV